MTRPVPGGPMTPQQALTTARLIAAGLTGGVLLLVAAAGIFEVKANLQVLVAPAALLGLVAPVFGYRLYEMLRERVPGDASRTDRSAAFLRATIAALSVTEGIAFFGVVAYLLSQRFFALVGVLTHVILTGALWPSEQRLERFLGSEPNFPAEP